MNANTGKEQYAIFMSLITIQGQTINNM